MLQGIVKKGQVLTESVPAPVVSKGSLLIKVVNSCISAGTEMSGVVESSKSIIKKALEQPEKVKKVLDMARSEGLSKTFGTVKGKLAVGNPTGYSISGVVIGIGESVEGFEIGNHVAAAGAGLANHAEYVDVPENLVMKMPKKMSFKDASTVTLGGIAMQGVRRADLKLGEYCVVVGAGILGLLALQMLKASGIRVIVSDLDEKRLRIASDLGAEMTINPSKEDLVKKVGNLTGGFGTDAVLFTAATANNKPLAQSFQMCKKKGKVILVGVVGMQINREDIYAKELDFMISTSYGPGRYDQNYEEKGLDYPYAYVRWTENRNMTEYLRLVNQGVIRLEQLIDNSYPVEKISEAFESLKTAEEKPLIVLVDYGLIDTSRLSEYTSHTRKVSLKSTSVNKDVINVAVIGAGGFATGVHLPNFKQLPDKYAIHAIHTRTGYKAKTIAQQYNAKYATTNIDEILEDTEVDLVLIATRHDSHADLTLKALKAGKHVFVEKPMAINLKEVEEIEEFYQKENDTPKPLLFVGFNRRFSQYAQEIKTHTSKRINPLVIHYRMNAGYIPLDHWVHENNGRIVGEACHIIDLMNFFTESKISSISSEKLTPSTSIYSGQDNCSIILKYEDGSICTIEYFSVGSKNFPKENMEIHFDEKTIVLDDYKSMQGYGVKLKEVKSSEPKKGQFEELEQLYQSLKGKIEHWPIELEDMIQTTKATILIN